MVSLSLPERCFYDTEIYIVFCNPFNERKDFQVVTSLDVYILSIQSYTTVIATKLAAIPMMMPIVPTAISVAVVWRTVGTIAITMAIMFLF